MIAHFTLPEPHGGQRQQGQAQSERRFERHRPQRAGIEQVNRAIGDMDSPARQNAARIEQAAAAASGMSELAEQLARAVKEFAPAQSPFDPPNAHLVGNGNTVPAVVPMMPSCPNHFTSPPASSTAMPSTQRAAACSMSSD